MPDVIVVGAGPAGTVTAALLGRLGYEVEIWERARFPRHRIGESLPPRCVALLEHLGYELNGFAVMRGHTSIWGEPAPQRAVFPDGHGLQVDRGEFDQALLDRSGATVRFQRSVVGLIRDGDRVAGVRSADGEECRARFVVVASGPGKGERHLRQSALFGYWQKADHPPADQDNDTIIESFADGWVWSLRLQSGLRNVTVVFDNPISYHDGIARTSFVRDLVRNGELVGRPQGCDASWIRAANFAEPGLILVGDAASVIDPLASQGIYKALCSAITASAVVHTSLRTPAMEAMALRFHNEEELRMFNGYSAGSVATFRREQRWPESPFWKSRHALTLWDFRQRQFSPELAADLESGRAGDQRLKTCDGVRIEPRPTISGPLIELIDYVVSPGFDYGYRGIYAETMIAVHNACRQPRTVSEVAGSIKDIDTPTLLKVISYMYKEGLIEPL